MISKRESRPRAAQGPAWGHAEGDDNDVLAGDVESPGRTPATTCGTVAYSSWPAQFRQGV